MNKKKFIVISTIIVILIAGFLYSMSTYSYHAFYPDKFKLGYIISYIPRGCIVYGLLPILFLIEYIHATKNKDKYFDLDSISKYSMLLNISIIVIFIIDLLYYNFIIKGYTLYIGTLFSPFMRLAVIPFEIAYLALIIWLFKSIKEITKKGVFDKLKIINIIIFIILTLLSIKEVYYSIFNSHVDLIFFIMPAILIILQIVYFILKKTELMLQRKYSIILLIINIILLLLNQTSDWLYDMCLLLVNIFSIRLVYDYVKRNIVLRILAIISMAASILLAILYILAVTIK